MPALIAKIVRAMLGALMLIVLHHPANGQDKGDADKLRALALELVNKARAEHKLPPLKFGKDINEAAKMHAADMLRRDYFAHQSPEGKNVQDRYLKAGGSRWRLTAENIAYCKGCDLSTATLEQLQRGWMNSKGHRENILRKGLTEFGFSMVTEPGHPVYAVQTFLGPGIPNGLGANEKAKRLSDAELAGKALDAFNTVRKQAGHPALAQSPALDKAAQSLLPKKNMEDFDLSKMGKLTEALSAAERGNWQKLTMLAAACGGCGAEPTGADVRSFVQQWLDKPQNKEMVLNQGATHLGFALAASGKGEKIALAVIGKKQEK